MRVVDHDGPEVLGRCIGGDVQPVGLAAVQVGPLPVSRRIGVLRARPDHLQHHGRGVDGGLVEEQRPRIQIAAAHTFV
ncbi:hypothetical protein D9M68_639820 [compost metagenome]